MIFRITDPSNHLPDTIGVEENYATIIASRLGVNLYPLYHTYIPHLNELRQVGINRQDWVMVDQNGYDEEDDKS